MFPLFSSSSALSRVIIHSRPILIPSLLCRLSTIATPNIPSPTAAQSTCRPFTDIPKLPSLPILGSTLELLRHDPSSNNTQLHNALISIHKQYGPLVRAKFMNTKNDTLFIADPDFVTHAFRAEPHYPVRPPLGPLKYHRIQAGLPLGIVLTDGEEWKRIRSASQDIIFKPSILQNTFTASVGPCTALLVQRLHEFLLSQGPDAINGQLTVNIEQLIMRWSIDAISVVIMGQELGALKEPPIPIALRALRDFTSFMRTLGPISRLPEFIWKYKLNSVSKEHFRALDGILDICNELINGVFSQFAQNPTQLNNTFLGYLLSQPDSLTKQEAFLMAADFTLAGIDTTARTSTNIMYYLSQYPLVQAKLRDEIFSVIGPTDHVQAQDLTKLKYFKQVLKETMRIIPNFYANARVLTKDAELGGYLIPSGTTLQFNHYVMSHDDNLVHDPHLFIPERWDSTTNKNNNTTYSKLHPSVSLPFGNGARMCIGRRIAEMELHVLFVHLLRKFELIPAPDKLILESTTGIHPTDFMPLRFRPLP